jgi:uncharacterized lipoprotein
MNRSVLLATLALGLLAGCSKPEQPARAQTTPSSESRAQRIEKLRKTDMPAAQRNALIGQILRGDHR